jgi:hypothetical protein
MKRNWTVYALLLFLVLIACVLLIGCTSPTLRQSDIEQAFDNSLQRYSIYNAQQIGYQTALALTNLSISGMITLFEPARPISDCLLAETVETGTLLATLKPGKLQPPAIPRPCNFVATSHSTLYYCAVTCLATLIFSGVIAGIYKGIQAIRRLRSVVC